MPGIIFEIPDKDGVPVSLSESTLLHIRWRHPEMDNHASAIQEVIRDPTLITRDTPGSLHFSRLGATKGKYHSLYLNVVVRYSLSDEGIKGQVKTAYFRSVPPKGELLWMKRP